MIESQDVLTPSPRVAFRSVGGQVVIVSTEERRLLTLNPTGSTVWTLLDGCRTVAQVAQELPADFRVAAEECLTDVLTFLEQMLSRGLVERREPGA